MKQKEKLNFTSLYTQINSLKEEENILKITHNRGVKNTKWLIAVKLPIVSINATDSQLPIVSSDAIGS